MFYLFQPEFVIMYFFLNLSNTHEFNNWDKGYRSGVEVIFFGNCFYLNLYGFVNGD